MKKHKSTTAVIATAGNGSRMKSKVAKQFIMLDGIPVLARTLCSFEKSPVIDQIVIVTGEHDIDAVYDIAKNADIKKLTKVVRGGKTRQESIYNALKVVKSERVLIHDGARPFVTQEQIAAVSDALDENDAAAPGIYVTDTIKSVDSSYITGTVDRTSLVSIQTPQGFKTEIIKNAHASAREKNITATDDCALCENMGIKIKAVAGSRTNIKLTTPDDLILAKYLLKTEKEN